MGASHDKLCIKHTNDVLEIVTDYADISEDERPSEDLPIKKVSEPLLRASCDGSSENKLKYLFEQEQPTNKTEYIDAWIGRNRSFSRIVTDVCEEMDTFCKKFEGEQARTSILARGRMSENRRLSFVVHDDDSIYLDETKFPDVITKFRRPSSKYVVQNTETTPGSSSTSFSTSGETTTSDVEDHRNSQRRSSSPAALVKPGILKYGTFAEIETETDPEFETTHVLRRSSEPSMRHSKRVAGSLMKWLKKEKKRAKKENGGPEDGRSTSQTDEEEIVMKRGSAYFTGIPESSSETSTTDLKSDDLGNRIKAIDEKSSILTEEVKPFVQSDGKKTLITSEGMKTFLLSDGKEKLRKEDLISLKDWREKVEESAEETEETPTYFSVDAANLVQDNEDYSHCSTCDHWYYMPEKSHEELMRLQRKYPQCSKINGHYEFIASKKKCKECRQSGKYAYTLPDFVTEEKGWGRCEECHRWRFIPSAQEDLAITKLKIDRTKFPFAFSFFAYYYPSDVDDRLLPFRRHVLARAVKNIQSKVHKDIFKQQFGDAFVDRRILSIERKTRTRIALCKMGMKFIKGLPRRRIVIFSPKIEFIHHALMGMEELLPDVMETALFHRPMPDNNSRSWTSSKNFCVRRHKCFGMKARRSANVLRTSWERNILPHRFVPPVLSSEKVPFKTTSLMTTSKKTPLTTSGSNVFQPPSKRNTGNHRAWNSTTQMDRGRKTCENMKTTKGTEAKPSLVLWKYSHPLIFDRHKPDKEEDCETCLSFVSIENRKPLDISELKLLQSLHMTETRTASSGLSEVVEMFKFPASYMTNMIFRQNGKGKATSLCLKNVLQRFHCSIERIQIHKEGNKNAYYKVIFRYKNFIDVLSACEVLGYTLRRRV